jgi:hypothetical protein
MMERGERTAMRRYSRKKTFIYSVVTLALLVLLAEACLHLVYIIRTHRPFPFRDYDESMHQVASFGEIPQAADSLAGGEMKWGETTIEVIHPYLGFVRDPERTPNTSAIGFPERDDDPFLRTGGDSLTVAVLGGSFAEGASVTGESLMQATLHDHGIDARILTLAMGGYKQPQQLVTLAYLLSHGARLDAVVNIDGFNEVALPQAENIPVGVNPFYPRAWRNRTLRLHDQVTLRRIGRILALQEDRGRWARLCHRAPAFSIVRNLVWSGYDALLQKRVAALNEQLRGSATAAAERFLTTGPEWKGAGGEELYSQIADHWRTCSILMKALCESKGIAYIHVLQPNQYYAPGRELTAEEQRVAFREDHAYRRGVVYGYPRLLERKDDLIKAGVDFHDLTMIYHGIPEPIYVDDCCHPNRMGYEIVVKYIAERIAEALR